MKIRFHHLNLCSSDPDRLNAFYRSVLDLEPLPGGGHRRINTDAAGGYGGQVHFVSDGQAEFHLSERDLGLGFRTGQPLNPVERGHIAFRTDDIEAFKQRLIEKGIPFADYGTWAVGGWHQIFFHDPDGNVVEVHQAGSSDDL
jgi:catechol 2,3-dioxygenase-like lactoylglutathione lyase family enzyme